MGYLLSNEQAQIIFRLERKDKELFDKYAKRNKTNPSNVLRQFVEEYNKRKGKDVNR